MTAVCPNGHRCRPVERVAGHTVPSGSYFYCGKCYSEPRYIAMSGDYARGMYWPRARVRALEVVR